jgi:uncharacterized metal-binding protein YceD (DUF177 family)
MTPELPRPIQARDIGGAGRRHAIEATPGERAALAARFDLLALDAITAALDVSREAAGIRVAGRVEACGAQACVATGEPVPFVHDEPVSLLLVETLPGAGEIELGEADLDSEPLLGDTIDLGEIAAQVLGLALDPYPRAAVTAPGVLSEAEARAAASPFASLRR